jgi:hypothetical protein
MRNNFQWKKKNENTMEEKGEKEIIGIILYSLFIFWFGGCISVLVDLDHIFVLIGRKPPYKFSESYGRPFHTRGIFIGIAVGISFVMASFGFRFYRGILQGVGEGTALLFLIGIIIVTGLVFRTVGNRLGRRLDRQRKVWKKGDGLNDLGMS